MITLDSVIVALAAILIYSAITEQMGFKVFTTPEGKPRFRLLGGFLNSFSVSPNEGDGFHKSNMGSSVKKWWGEKDEDNKKWSLYIAILIFAYLVHVVAINEYKLAARAIAALVPLHFVWGIVGKKMGLLTKVIVSGILIYFVLAWLVPDIVTYRDAKWSTVKKSVAEMATQAKKDDENYGKMVAKNPPVDTRAGYRPQTRVVEVTATEDRFTEVKIPSGVKFSIDCPDNGLAKVFHRDAPQGIVYDCARAVEVGENLHGFRIGFSSKTEKPVRVKVRITSQ
ncbi:MAG: hypothetical protein HZB11_02375 [Candidatus Yonathbacteria bacterium]|nr:hypothetical protein [Candidatus Yonathbacteria bacterium]